MTVINDFLFPAGKWANGNLAVPAVVEETSIVLLCALRLLEISPLSSIIRSASLWERNQKWPETAISLNVPNGLLETGRLYVTFSSASRPR